MAVGRTILFGFMAFFLILRKSNLIFFHLSSMLFIAAVSLGVGYGMAILLI